MDNNSRGKQFVHCREVVRSFECPLSEVPTVYIVRVINPRRAYAARVTVLGLSVCLSVCLSVSILALQATMQLMSDTNSLVAEPAADGTAEGLHL